MSKMELDHARAAFSTTKEPTSSDNTHENLCNVHSEYDTYVSETNPGVAIQDSKASRRIECLQGTACIIVDYWCIPVVYQDYVQ